MSIDQSNVVDSIGFDPSSGEIQLIITDHLGWSMSDQADGEHMHLLQEKINAYLRFIESGEIYTTYPKAKGKVFVIRVVAKFDLSPMAKEFCDGIRDTLLTSGHRITFEKLAVS